MEPDIHKLVCLCIQVQVYICMNASLHTCVLSTSISLYTYFISLNKYGCHITNIGHTPTMVSGNLDATFLHACQNMANYNIYTTCYCHVWSSNKYAP